MKWKTKEAAKKAKKKKTKNQKEKEPKEKRRYCSKIPGGRARDYFYIKSKN